MLFGTRKSNGGRIKVAGRAQLFALLAREYRGHDISLYLDGKHIGDFAWSFVCHQPAEGALKGAVVVRI